MNEAVGSSHALGRSVGSSDRSFSLNVRDASDAETNTSKRFDVELFIVHPTMDPAEISAALGLDAKFAHSVGDQRKTPRGTPLPGTYQDTRWRYSHRHETTDQWFVDKIAELIDCIEPHKAFFKELRSIGGTACLILQFLGDGYLGDEIPRAILAKLGELELDFGIECFAETQS